MLAEKLRARMFGTDSMRDSRVTWTSSWQLRVIPHKLANPMTPTNGEQRFLLDANLWYEIEGTHGESGGAYIVRCFEDLEDTVIPIDRLLGVDVSGILYVGAATCFTDRVITLKKSVSSGHNDTNHEFGVRYKESCSIQQRFRAERLVVTLVESENPIAEEAGILERYLQRYGELPPFNRRA